ncbi:MAG: tetratricopeptide repeat protein, partial [Candidatus Omnitrophica bacterium]|nr:tetratricopeptide repeat protein [Candidatus Omnitrophota bacterium]
MSFLIKILKTILTIFLFLGISLARISYDEASDLYTKANIFYSCGEFNKAIEIYQKLIQNDNLSAYLNLAIILKDLTRYSEAIELLKSIYEKFKDRRSLLILLGRLYYLNDQIDLAINAFKKILKLNPYDWEANLNLGLCFSEKKLFLEAEKYYKISLSIKENIIAHIELAKIFEQQGKFREAIQEYKEANKLDPSLLNIQKKIAELLFKTDELEEALRLYRRIQLGDPEDKTVQERISQISYRLGKEYFEREREKLSLLKRKKRVRVEPYSNPLGVPEIRVGLAQEINSFEFKCSGNFVIQDKYSKFNVFMGLEDRIYKISKEDNRCVVISGPDKNIIEAPFLIVPQKPQAVITIFNLSFGKANFWATQEARSFRGTMEVELAQKGLTLINILNLEEYLYSVVPSEMPPNWPLQALKA